MCVPLIITLFHSPFVNPFMARIMLSPLLYLSLFYGQDHAQSSSLLLFFMARIKLSPLLFSIIARIKLSPLLYSIVNFKLAFYRFYSSLVPIFIIYYIFLYSILYLYLFYFSLLILHISQPTPSYGPYIRIYPFYYTFYY
jgi:hypothetical protein